MTDIAQRLPFELDEEEDDIQYCIRCRCEADEYYYEYDKHCEECYADIHHYDMGLGRPCHMCYRELRKFKWTGRYENRVLREYCNDCYARISQEEEEEEDEEENEEEEEELI